MAKTIEDIVTTTPDDELVGLPVNAIPADDAALFQSRIARLQEDLLTYDSTLESDLPYFMDPRFALLQREKEKAQQQQDHDKDQTARHRLEQEETLENYQSRMDNYIGQEKALQAQANNLKEQVAEQRRLLDARTIKVNGQSVYLDGDHFVDANGNRLSEADEKNAQGQLKDHPDAATYEQKKKLDELDARVQQQDQNVRDHTAQAQQDRDNGANMSPEERKAAEDRTAHNLSNDTNNGQLIQIDMNNYASAQARTRSFGDSIATWDKGVSLIGSQSSIPAATDMALPPLTLPDPPPLKINDVAGSIAGLPTTAPTYVPPPAENKTITINDVAGTIAGLPSTPPPYQAPTPTPSVTATPISYASTLSSQDDAILQMTFTKATLPTPPLTATPTPSVVAKATKVDDPTTTTAFTTAASGNGTETKTAKTNSADDNDDDDDSLTTEFASATSPDNSKTATATPSPTPTGTAPRQQMTNA